MTAAAGLRTSPKTSRRATQKGLALATKIDAFFKLGGIVVMLLASAGVGSHYARSVPQRNAQLDNAQRLETARADADHRAVPMQLLAQQQEQEQRPSPANAAAEIRYQACLSSASASHDASWAAECKRLAEQTEQDRANCLVKLDLPKTYCDASYARRDASANCRLPDEIATVLNAALQQARYRCAREREAALQ